MKKNRLAILRASMLSPTGMLLYAGLATALFLIIHLAGLREYVTVISGTSPTGDPLDMRSVLTGAAYVFAWFGFVLVAPILLIAAWVLALFRRLLPFVEVEKQDWN